MNWILGLGEAFEAGRVRIMDWMFIIGPHIFRIMIILFRVFFCGGGAGSIRQASLSPFHQHGHMPD